MTTYVKIVSEQVSQFPYTIGDLRRENPRTSFPLHISNEALANFGVYEVTFASPPNIEERTQKTEQNAQPTFVNGAWTVGWSTSAKTTEEVQQYDDDAGQAVRSQRSVKLNDTDWLVLKEQETGVSIGSEMAAYRQALRDITTHANWPHLEGSDWPTKP